MHLVFLRMTFGSYKKEQEEMKQSKKLHIALWVAQGLVAAAFIMAGIMKLISPLDDLAANGMSFVHTFSEGMVRFIGISEVLGGLGLIFPALLRIKPILTPMAAIGLAVIMVLAAVFHVMQGEPPIPNLVLLVLAVFIAWGRLRKVPIHSR